MILKMKLPLSILLVAVKNSQFHAKKMCNMPVLKTSVPQHVKTTFAHK